jgi:hypothetical protein
MTLPRKWPVPAGGQVLTVTKPQPGGWISAAFWPADGGVSISIFQAVVGDRVVEDASDNPMAAGWIPAIGMTHMLARGANAFLVGSEGLLGELDGWRAEILLRNAA